MKYIKLVLLGTFLLNADKLLNFLSSLSSQKIKKMLLTEGGNWAEFSVIFLNIIVAFNFDLLFNLPEIKVQIILRGNLWRVILTATWGLSCVWED